jgi:acetyl/propionyl-CoA carboxylase alpha subunit
MFGRVLIANRGEIARRITRTCARLGIATVAVYSEVDADEPHVREADQAVCLGPAPPTASYLAIDRVVDAARAHGCDAVHPGYGFLAENAAFAEAVQAAGLTFVGPSPRVLRLLGDKAAAKRHLEEAGVPVIPGEHDPDLDDGQLVGAGERLGTPLLVKAVAGGGGKGMRAVTDLATLPTAIAAARREAAAAFGDERLLLERLIAQPRHVEVQVIGDRVGTVLHLGERECSVQRRHQKLVEETPSPAVDQALRERMTQAAVTAARSVGYEGAGTVEFLVAGDTLDDEQPRFAFLEVNTRLQVEHPVTELVTGLDLVELQLRVAAGEPLGLEQDEVAMTGHAIEVRLYAEDPVAYLPQTGPVLRAHLPRAPGVRIDSGVETGSTVTRHYDPLIAKLIAAGPDRATALARLRTSLDTAVVHGVATNLDLLTAILDEPAFRAGELTTGFLEDHLEGFAPAATPTLSWLAAAAAFVHGVTTDRGHGPWARLGPRRPAGARGGAGRRGAGRRGAGGAGRAPGGPPRGPGAPARPPPPAAPPPGLPPTRGCTQRDTAASRARPTARRIQRRSSRRGARPTDGAGPRTPRTGQRDRRTGVLRRRRRHPLRVRTTRRGDRPLPRLLRDRWLVPRPGRAGGAA